MKSFKQHGLRWLAFAALCGATAAHAQAQAQQPASAAAAPQATRIAVVNSERILRESIPAKLAQSKLEQEFSKRDHDLQDMAAKLKAMSDQLDKAGPTMSTADRSLKQTQIAQLDADFQRKQREFREDLNQRRNEELAAVLDRANKVIKQIAEQEHYDLILQEAVYVSPRIDITDQVIKVLGANASAPAGASATQ
ncbi:OmpH family outer membrane protein [Pararobbsia silviterrae]|uniref:OmpH family outer membrane protein n=1 Tax=Pararobbsia silviterrae TaxID=1792498 RepID=A0A494XVL6_9BURK|nr:OmpH family outer membrane protein [Pararobbsia silviterrae]RKP54661.1 OmpH family outer membrane protein [Pararobbsia silviterrae]